MKKTAIIIILCITCAAVSAHNFASIPLHQESSADNYRRIWSLQIGAADGYGTFRDMGTAPISFNGLLLQQTLGLHLVFPKHMEFSIVSRSSIGAFEDAVDPMLNFSSFDVNNMLRLKFMKATKKAFADSSIFHLYLGASLCNFLDVTVNPNYENAAAGVSNFFGPEAIAHLRMEPKWNVPVIFHGELALMPVAAVLRPGYSYIDNYTATNSVIDALFSDFEVNVKPFAAISTDIGIDIITGPASRISFSYLWNYLSTGNSGFHRFDHASHLLAIDFIIKLRTREKQ